MSRFARAVYLLAVRVSDEATRLADAIVERYAEAWWRNERCGQCRVLIHFEDHLEGCRYAKTWLDLERLRKDAA